jgi:hypothetical protein
MFSGGKDNALIGKINKKIRLKMVVFTTARFLKNLLTV